MYSVLHMATICSLSHSHIYAYIHVYIYAMFVMANTYVMLCEPIIWMEKSRKKAEAADDQRYTFSHSVEE